MAKNKEFVNELKIAYHKYSKAKGISLIDHAFKRAYDDKDQVLIALLKKILPDKLEGEGFGDKFDIYALIKQIQQDVHSGSKPPVELDNGNGVDAGPARQDDTVQEVPG